MNIKIDIHSHEVEKKLNELKIWKVPESTKKEICEFVDKARLGQVNEGKKLSERTIYKDLTLLRKSLEIINKPTSKITKKDIEDFEKKVSSQNLKSVSDYRLVLKIFLKWKLGFEKMNNLAGWLETKTKEKTPDYLSEKEIEKLYKNCKNSSERFLIAVLFDSGARAEEFLNIRYEDIQLPDKNQNFVKLTLKEEYSKTKGRVISLYWKNSLEAVDDFLSERKEEGIKFNEPVFKGTYDNLRFFLYRLSLKVLNKKINPHLFRHSSSTHYASKLNRQELCYRYGWAFSSRMPDVYISRAGMENKQLDDKFENTELGELKTKLSKEEFERKKMEEDFKIFQENSISEEDSEQLKKFLPLMKKINQMTESQKLRVIQKSK